MTKKEMNEKAKAAAEEVKAKALEHAEKMKESFEEVLAENKSRFGIIAKHVLEAQKELLEFQLGLVEEQIRSVTQPAPKAAAKKSAK